MAYIYKILNKVNGKFYIGSTKNAKVRWYQHKYSLNNNKHINNHLQNAWNKYGKDSFDFIILEENIPSDKKFEIEQAYFKKLNPFPPQGYNIATQANGGGVSFYSEMNIKEVKKLLSEGVCNIEVSNITGVSQSTINSVKMLRSWEDVGEEYNEVLKLIIEKQNNKISEKELTDDILEEAYKLKNSGMGIKEIHSVLNLCSRVLGKKLKIYTARKNGKKIKSCIMCGVEMILKSNNSNKKYCKECKKVRELEQRKKWWDDNKSKKAKTISDIKLKGEIINVG